MTHTTDTVTDAQIRELRTALLYDSTPFEAAKDPVKNPLLTVYDDALYAPLGSLRRVTARARCAEMLNKIAQDRCVARKHDDHVRDVCEGQCCTSCGGPIDENEECRC